MTAATLEAEKTDEKFQNFYKNIVKSAKDIGLEEPFLPRQRSIPDRYEGSLTEIPIFEDVEEMYQFYYLQSLEAIISNIKERFDQDGYKMVMNLENLLLKCAKGQDYSEEFENVTNFYGSDLDKDVLQAQLLTFRLQFKEEDIDLKKIIEVMKKENYCYLLSEISTVLKLILTLPATNAESERVFSHLRLVKTYLRSTMSQKRLNSILLIKYHKKAAKDVCLDEVAEEFISRKEGRRADFGLKKCT